MGGVPVALSSFLNAILIHQALIERKMGASEISGGRVKELWFQIHKNLIFRI